MQRIRRRITSAWSSENGTSTHPHQHVSIQKKVTRPAQSSWLSLGLWSALVGMLLFGVAFVTIGTLFRSSSTLQQMTIFMNYMSLRLAQPEDYDLMCTRNLKVNSSDGISLGAWHVVASPEMCTKTKNQLNEQKWFDDERLVVLYTHGAGGTRGSGHRVALCKFLRDQLNVHVLTFDYRGFGDSSNQWPDASGVANDTATVWNWLIAQGVAEQRIIVWAHSLGTAVALRFLSSLPPESSPRAIILEAPFTSMREASVAFPVSKIFSYVPYFAYYFMEPLASNPKTNFDSVSLLNRIHSPLLILHAKDDIIVPFHLGEKLYHEANRIQAATVPRPRFSSFCKQKGLGHRNLVYDLDLPRIVMEFIKLN